MLGAGGTWAIDMTTRRGCHHNGITCLETDSWWVSWWVMLTTSYSVPRVDMEASDDPSSVMLATEVTQASPGPCPVCPKTFSLISASFPRDKGCPADGSFASSSITCAVTGWEMASQPHLGLS